MLQPDGQDDGHVLSVCCPSVCVDWFILCASVFSSIFSFTNIDNQTEHENTEPVL